MTIYLTTSISWLLLLLRGTAGGREAHEDLERVVDHPLQASLVKLAVGSRVARERYIYDYQGKPYQSPNHDNPHKQSIP